MNFLSRVLSFLLRVVVLLAGLVFAASMLVAGVVVALVFVLRSLLAGKRPASVRWRMASGSRGRSAPWFQTAGARHSGADMGDVVDVQAREVPSAAQRRLPPEA
ncbi:hypothetical protein [Methylibium rhizosphaerae]|uniref:hypothetical protein n=1 Tax=Methylibium rhizosphaerae TaxID=2570323 RepID=UPI0011275A36|nr:hypothetical protein [Methylibium rhizosphaerae]